jgi:prolyl 4-hydroxylase
LYIDPKHPRAAGNVKWYEDMLLEEGIKKSDTTNLPPIVNMRDTDSGLPERDMYEALCRGEVPVVSV